MLQASLASMFVRAANNLDLPDVTIIDGERVRVRPTTALIRSMMRDRLSREEAVNRAVRRSWESNRNEPNMREELGRRFDGLDLEERRNLV